MLSNKNYRRWFVQGTGGIIIFGSGLSMCIEAGFFKYSQPPTWQWILAGTTALAVVMAGLILMIDSIRYRIRYEREQEREEEREEENIR